MRLNLYELYKNKMLLRSCILLFLVGTFSVFGQNANAPASTAIKANFTMASVKAYQESATLKVEDYYHYLTLFSAESTSESLKNEIKTYCTISIVCADHVGSRSTCHTQDCCF